MNAHLVLFLGDMSLVSMMPEGSGVYQELQSVILNCSRTCVR